MRENNALFITEPVGVSNHRENQTNLFQSLGTGLVQWSVAGGQWSV
jgi:hypothetical protein